MPDVRLELDMEDARRLQRLAELGAHVDAIDPDNDRVLAYLSFQVVLAERERQSA